MKVRKPGSNAVAGLGKSNSKDFHRRGRKERRENLKNVITMEGGDRFCAHADWIVNAWT